MTAPVQSVAKRVGRALRRLIAPEAPAAPAALYPKSVFMGWGYDDAEEAIEQAVQDSELDSERALRESSVTPIPDQAVYQDPRQSVPQLTINRAFFDGDHWQMGAGWIGPHPQQGDADYSTAMNELVAAFTSKNVIREVVKRHASGVIGKAPTWSFVPRRALAQDEEPTTEEATAVTEANRIVREWWDAKKVRSLLHDATCTLLFASRAPLRLYIPAGLLTSVVDTTGKATNIVRAESVQQALGMIYPDHPVPEHAAVVQDDDTKMEAGVRVYEADGARDNATEESKAADGAGGNDSEDQIELVFLDPTGQTVIRILRDEDEATDAEEYGFDFGARLTMIEMRRDPLITPQVAQNQRALNLCLSMLPRSVITGGFMERVLLNAQMPGHYEKDADGLSTGRFIPDYMQFGPNTTNFFAGLETKNADGSRTLAQPDVKWRDPVPVDSPVKAADAHYTNILDETSQLHVVLSGDAVVSGKSREQARAEYLNSLGDTKPEIDAALRFLLETPLAMAEALAGTPGLYTSLVRVEASCRFDTGPLSETERAANETSIGKSLSQETAMARNGVDDVDAELVRMSDDPLARATLALTQGTALVQLTTAGMSIATAAAMIGIDGEIAQQIIADSEVTFQNPTAPAVPTDGSTTPAAGQATPPKPAPKDGAATGSKSADQSKRDTTQASGGNVSAAGGSN